MATSSTAKAAKTAEDAKAAAEDLQAELALLREDIARIAAQLADRGEDTFSAAKRAASEGAEHIRARGEAAVDALKENAHDLEKQVADAVREKPLTSLAIAAGVGFFFALLTRR